MWNRKKPDEELIRKPLDELPRGVGDASSGNREYLPAAHWEDPEDIAADPFYRHEPGKLFLGVIGGHVEIDPDTEEPFIQGGTSIGIADDRHAVLCVGSRGGKGRSVIVPNLLTYPGSALVIDPKGELANITAVERSEKLEQDVYVLDPFGITAHWVENYRKKFNPMSVLFRDEDRPLDEREIDTLMEDAGLIADALVISSSERDAHWDESARTLIEGVLLLVALAPQYKGRCNLTTVHEVLRQKSHPGDDGRRVLLGSLEKEMSDCGDLANGVIAAAASDFFDRPPGEQGSVLSTVRRHTHFLGYPAMQSVLSDHDFDLEDLKTNTKGATIYLVLPASRLATVNRWFRLFINLMLKAMEEEKTKPQFPVLAILEEMHVLGHMRELEMAAALMAGMDLKFHFILQDLTQLQRHYKESWSTFLGNSGVVQLFSNNDQATLDYASKRLDRRAIRVDRHSGGAPALRTGRVHAPMDKAWAWEVHDLLTPGEVARYTGRTDEHFRQLVMLENDKKLVLQRAFYDKHNHFKDCIKKPPQEVKEPSR